MGYFSNGTEGDFYLDRYCFRCKNWKTRNDDPGESCPIWEAHLFHNGESVFMQTLNSFIPREGGWNKECVFFNMKEDEKCA